MPTGAKGHGKPVAFVAFSVFREWEGPSSSIIIENHLLQVYLLLVFFVVSRLSIVPRMNHMRSVQANKTVKVEPGRQSKNNIHVPHLRFLTSAFHKLRQKVSLRQQESTKVAGRGAACLLCEGGRRPPPSWRMAFCLSLKRIFCYF